MTAASHASILGLAAEHRRDATGRALKLARHSLANSDLLGVRAACRVALSHEPDEPDAWYLLGCAAAASGELLEALEALDRALDARPDWVDARVRRSRLLQWNADYVGALGDLDAAVLSCPVVDPDLLAERAFVRRYLGDLGGAERDYRRASRHVAPGSPRARSWLEAADRLGARRGVAGASAVWPTRDPQEAQRRPTR